MVMTTAVGMGSVSFPALLELHAESAAAARRRLAYLVERLGMMA
jgi:hypothetical protein